LDWHSIHHGDETERRKWQNPEAILSEIGLKSGQTFVDIGCGDGSFAIPAARLVKKAASLRLGL
jgi:cyclopropane fatty-acyl-phospholipid synthase-like methyltransferase